MKQPGILDRLRERGIVGRVLADLLGLDEPPRPRSTVRCPGHDDGTASFVVGRNGEGGACRAAGCGIGGGLLDLVRTLKGLRDRAAAASWIEARYLGDEEAAGTRNERPESKRKPRVVKTTRYEIKDAEGNVVAVHVRRETYEGVKRIDKGFSWELPDGTLGLAGRACATLPLYGTEMLKDADPREPVVLTEGEKAADALRGLGLLALATITGAAGTPSREVLAALKGRRVFLWPDNDEGGSTHMARIAAILDGLGADVRLVEWKDAPLKGDAADFVEAGGKREDVNVLLAVARPWTPTEAQAEARAPAPAPFTVLHGGGADEPDRFEEWLAPLVALGEEPAAGDLDRALRQFAASIEGLDPLQRATARDAALRELKRAKVAKPAAILEAAIPPRTPARDAKQGRALSLEDPEPWPKPVDGAALLDALAALLRKYLILPEHAAEFLALWIVHTYAIEAANATPYPGISSPTKRCGKTTLLSLLKMLARRALPASSITAAALFRAIERFEPTLLIDEADTVLHENEELRCVLNSGHTRGTAFVLRTAGDEHEPRAFSTWGPKAIALIGKLPPTIADRGVEIRMRRKRKDEKVARFRARDVEPLAADLRRQLVRWVADNLATLKEAAPAIPESLNDRMGDSWEPLLAIADLAGGAWPKLARAAAVGLSTGDDDEAGVLLLGDIRGILGNAERIKSAELCDSLKDREDRPWAEWKGKGLTQNSLARLLKPFGIAPNKLRFGNETAGGYRAEWFAEAFRTYLADDTEKPKGERNRNTGTPPHGKPDPEDSQPEHGHDEVPVESGRKPAPEAACSDVPVEEPPEVDEWAHGEAP